MTDTPLNPHNLFEPCPEEFVFGGKQFSCEYYNDDEYRVYSDDGLFYFYIATPHGWTPIFVTVLAELLRLDTLDGQDPDLEGVAEATQRLILTTGLEHIGLRKQAAHKELADLDTEELKLVARLDALAGTTTTSNDVDATVAAILTSNDA